MAFELRLDRSTPSDPGKKRGRVFLVKGTEKAKAFEDEGECGWRVVGARP